MLCGANQWKVYAFIYLNVLQIFRFLSSQEQMKKYKTDGSVGCAAQLTQQKTF